MAKPIFNDPWRQPLAPPEPKPTAVPQASEEELANADISNPAFATITLPGYGGITLYGSDDPQVLVQRLLEFCVLHRKQIDSILTQYGILVVHLALSRPPTPFFIQRGDGWTLTVPGATTRNEGLLQLIQALLDISQRPSLKPLLDKYGIQPFKN